MLFLVMTFIGSLSASGSGEYGKFIVNGEEPDILETFAKIQMEYGDFQEGKVKTLSPLAHTDIFHFSRGKGLEFISDVVVSSEEDWKRILNGEFRYFPFYTMRIGRTKEYEKFGALVIGEDDPIIENVLLSVGAQLALKR